MDIKELHISLKRQEENLAHLLITVTNKQRAIVAGKIEKIEEVIFEEEKLFKSIDSQEKHRVEMIASLAQRLGVNLANNNLNDFLVTLKPRLDPKLFNEFMNIRNNIIVLVKKVNLVNQQNKILIAQSISFIKSTITSLVDTRKNSLVDRRI